jgi:hypothetical protein
MQAVTIRDGENGGLPSELAKTHDAGTQNAEIRAATVTEQLRDVHGLILYLSLIVFFVVRSNQGLSAV